MASYVPQQNKQSSITDSLRRSWTLSIANMERQHPQHHANFRYLYFVASVLRWSNILAMPVAIGRRSLPRTMDPSACQLCLPPHLREVCTLLAIGIVRLRRHTAEDVAHDAEQAHGPS
jgi:hypothetical protein